MRHKNFDSFDANIGLPIFTTSLIIIITACAISEATYLSTKRCHASWGNYLVMAGLSFFFIVVIPVIWWRLRNYKDEHGIRNEILIQCIVSIPCIVMFMIWIIVFEPTYSETPSVIRTVFIPGNWGVIMTTIGHFFFILRPLVRSYQKDENITITDDYGERDDEDHYRQQQQQRRRRLGSTIDQLFDSTTPHYEMTKNALEQALEDPDAMKILKELATKDFSVENILFYGEYLKLRRKI
ncbi:hypothetical protein BDA99DRAFT_441542, partial [Phascolomyces articulosus]